MKPRCLFCGRHLRKYRWAGQPGFSADKQWGGYGDGHFCGLSCGYNWSITKLTREADYAACLHVSMEKVMTEKP